MFVATPLPPDLRALPRAEKLRLIRLLARDVEAEEATCLLPPWHRDDAWADSPAASADVLRAVDA